MASSKPFAWGVFGFPETQRLHRSQDMHGGCESALHPPVWICCTDPLHAGGGSRRADRRGEASERCRGSSAEVGRSLEDEEEQKMAAGGGICRGARPAAGFEEELGRRQNSKRISASDAILEWSLAGDAIRKRRGRRRDSGEEGPEQRAGGGAGSAGVAKEAACGKRRDSQREARKDARTTKLQLKTPE